MGKEFRESARALRNSRKCIATFFALVAPSIALADTSVPQRLDEVVVESAPLEKSPFELAQPVTVLSGESLQQSVKPSLGETLSSQPGISSSYFGPGASRPVIRGLGGDRVKILENGTSSLDVSNTSPDHLVTVNPGTAKKIEVVRGPAALLYGTSAVGGVVNVFDNRIADVLPDKPLVGSVQGEYATGSELRNGAFDLTTPIGPFAVHVDGFKQKSNDINIPGYARTAAVRESTPIDYPEPKGTLSFSDSSTDTLTLGTSYIFDQGFFGASVSDFNSNYGVPNGEDDVSIDAHRRRVDVKGELRDEAAFITKVATNVGIVDYKHTEFEGIEPGTQFKKRGLDGRIDMTHADIGPLSGLLGVQFQQDHFEALGEEAFQPPTNTSTYSLFLFEESKVRNDLAVQLGGRMDLSYLDTDGFAQDAADSLSRNFAGFSQSAGTVWNPVDNYAVSLSLAHTERAPSGQELFADGPHVATGVYEVGNPDLDLERSIGIDLNLKRESGAFRGFIGGFYNYYWNYIGLIPTGEEQDDLPVYDFTGVRADFLGFESKLEYYLVDEGDREFSFDYQPDYVWAQDQSNNQPLPYMPPLRMKFGVNYYDRQLFRSRLELQQVFSQHRTAEDVTSTDGYTFLNASISRDFEINSHTVQVYLRGTNLLNEKARDSVSFIKDVAPLQGISVMSGVKYLF